MTKLQACFGYKKKNYKFKLKTRLLSSLFLFNARNRKLIT